MTDKEKLDAIRAEIHRLVDVRGYDRGMANDLFAFMDSLPNEPISDDLESEIRKEYKNFIKDGDVGFMEVARHFARWQKEQMYTLMGKSIISNYNAGYEKGLKDKEEQMMENVLESRVTITSGGLLFDDLHIEDVDYADKVKLIFLKEE